ncbi:MAG: hypothetical protein JXR91_10465 [Deltaproteobacteria bacterium]|nr:hypothetical protein [Deltaproteobacteria bacterium]
MCVVDDINCTGDTEEQCSENGVLGLTCDYNIDPPVAVITTENGDTEQNPICVEKDDGTVGYSNYPGTCDFVDSGLIHCKNRDQIMCIEGGLVWYIRPLHPYCDCLDETDQTGLNVVNCDNDVPCNETTGEYSLCGDGDTAMFIDKCNDAETTWVWSRNECSPTVPNCVMDGDIPTCVE